MKVLAKLNLKPFVGLQAWRTLTFLMYFMWNKN